MNVVQCRMARAGLGWSLDDLAREVRSVQPVSRRTIARFEAGGSVSAETVETLRQCFVKAGVEFINGGKSLGVKVPRD